MSNIYGIGGLYNGSSIYGKGGFRVGTPLYGNGGKDSGSKIYNKIFLPSQIPGLKLWTRFNSGITVTGSGVSQWDDVSGQGNHLKQGTDTNRPSKEVDGSILFDGVDNYLISDAFTLDQPVTYYLLFKHVTWVNNAHIINGGQATNVTLAQSGTTPNLVIFAGSTPPGNANLALDTYGIAAYVINGANSVLRINNITSTVGDAGSSNPGGVILGAFNAPSNFSNLQAKELIVYSSAHDSITADEVINYLAVIGNLTL